MDISLDKDQNLRKIMRKIKNVNLKHKHKSNIKLKKEKSKEKYTKNK